MKSLPSLKAKMEKNNLNRELNTIFVSSVISKLSE